MWVVNGVVVVDGGLLLYDLGPGARAGHGGAEEDVNQEHDGEEDPEGDAKPQQPGGLPGANSQPSRAVVHGGWEFKNKK